MKELAIMVMAHKGYLKWLKPCLESYQKIAPKPSYILLCFDNPFIAERSGYTVDTFFPPIDVLSMTNSIMISDKVYREHVGISWMWMQTYGAKFLESYGFEYIFSINGDCILEIPESFVYLFDRLKYSDKDVYSYEYTGPDGVGTLCYIAKAKSLAQINSHMLPYYWETTANNLHYSPEAIFAHCIFKNGFTVLPVEENPHDSQHHHNLKGTFWNYIGLRHLHGGEKWRQREHHKPYPERFFDTRFVDPPALKALRYFWDTGKTDKLIEDNYWAPQPLSNEAELYPEPY